MKVKVSNLYIQNQSIRQETLRIGRKGDTIWYGPPQVTVISKKKKKGKHPGHTWTCNYVAL